MNKFLTLTLVLLISGTSFGQNWPQWRGPDATGAASGNPPLTWSETENIKWKIEFPGQSASTPIIWGDKIFFQTAIETDIQPTEAQLEVLKNRKPTPGSRPPKVLYNFDLVCLDKNTGKLFWHKTCRRELPHEGVNRDNTYASFSPVTDGKHIWINYGSHGIYCYDFDGNQIWTRNLGQVTTLYGHGESSSPAIIGDAMIVVMDQEPKGSFIIAVNKLTGETLWKKDRDETTTWATPLGVEIDGRQHVVVLGIKFTRCYDVKTGEVLWQCGGQTLAAVPTPVSGFNLVFCTSGFNGAILQAIKLDSQGDITGTEAVKWQVKEATPYVPSPLLYQDKLYVTAVNDAAISCYQAETGKQHYLKQRITGLRGLYSSPIGVADRIYITGRRGTTAVLKAGNKFEILATNKLNDAFDCSPVIIKNEIFLKGKNYLYCITEQK
ncbi:MAG: PQQ-binding-like beta-propeller repeat protein [Planctomycetes bacterium]|nr:PQQ-binding-like beta-propeller repeat protein [Planctomycetota bacterium]